MGVRSGRWDAAVALGIGFGLGLGFLAGTESRVVGAPVFVADEYAFFVFEGEGADDWFSNRVYGVGDVSGDGRRDVLVSARRWDSPPDSIWRGKFYLFDGVTGALVRAFEGEADYDEFAHRVESVGDITGDDLDDFLVAAYQNDEGGFSSGKVYLYSGGDGSLIRTWVGDQGDTLGYSIATPGDLDGDTVNDLLFSAYRRMVDGDVDVGQVHAISGATLEPLYPVELVGESANAMFGWRVEKAGDVNADGRPDFIVSAYRHSEPDLPECGRVYVFSGLTGETLWTFTGDTENERFGLRVQTAGDVDGDGHDEILASSGDYADGAGRSKLFNGATGELMIEITGSEPDEELGYRVAGVADLDEDGWRDILATAPFNNANGFDAGRAIIVSSRTGETIVEYFGDTALELFGSSVQEGLDLNGDGIEDFVISAPKSDDRGTASGRLYGFSGVHGRVLFAIDGVAAGDRFGDVTLAAGDINQDGLDDYTVGSRRAAVGGLPEVGRAFIMTTTPIYLGVSWSQARELVTMEVTGAEPGELCHFVASLDGFGVSSPIPELGGMSLDLLDPLSYVGATIVDEYGEATIARVTSWVVDPLDAYMQATIVRGAGGVDSIKSNAVHFRIER
ncbi:MAG: integrin alpha [Phycisphaerales bacterium]